MCRYETNRNELERILANDEVRKATWSSRIAPTCGHADATRQPERVQSGGNPGKFHCATFHGTAYRYHKGCNTGDSREHPADRSVSFEAMPSPFRPEYMRSRLHFSQQLPAS
jgi:hypothetical protein